MNNTPTKINWSSVFLICFYVLYSALTIYASVVGAWAYEGRDRFSGGWFSGIYFIIPTLLFMFWLVLTCDFFVAKCIKSLSLITRSLIRVFIMLVVAYIAFETYPNFLKYLPSLLGHSFPLK